MKKLKKLMQCRRLQKTKTLLKKFWQEEDGMGTIEVVILIAVLVAVALLFKDGIEEFVNDMMDKFFDTNKYDVEPMTRT